MKSITRYAHTHLNARISVAFASEEGIEMLKEVHNKLYLIYDELQRMEYEGGIPLTQEQNMKIYSYLTVCRNIGEVLSDAQEELERQKTAKPKIIMDNILRCYNRFRKQNKNSLH